MNQQKEVISPKNILTNFQEKFEQTHIFFNKSTIDKSIEFLNALVKIQNSKESKRVVELTKISKIIIDLWEMMLESALKVLYKSDGIKRYDTIKGIARLKEYLKSYKEFEMIFYGSNKWYRDTIYHQVWFYFVGEFLFSKLDILKKIINKNFDWYCVPIEGNEKEKEKTMYAFFCVVALCHDLGKPLGILHPINDAIRSMLKNYRFVHFTPFKIEFPLTYKHMLNYLIKRLGQSVTPAKVNGKLTIKKWSEITKKNVIQEHRGEDSHFVQIEKIEDLPHLYAGFSTALSELDHGVLSCLLLAESFRYFRDGEKLPVFKNSIIKYENCNESWIQKSFLNAHEIMKTIAYHNIKTIILSDIKLPYFWAHLVDDLIESYRPTRAGKDFIISNICEVYIKKASLDIIHISFSFDRVLSRDDKEDIKDIIHFFIDKLEKYYPILDIEGFEFIFDVKLKKITDIDKKNNSILMRFHFKKRNGKIVFKISFQKNGFPIKIANENECIKKILRKGPEKGKNYIFKVIFRNLK